MADKVNKRTIMVSNTHKAGGAWFLGFIGALIYFLHFHSGTFSLVVVAIIKAIFWPAALIYYVLRFIGA